MRDSQHISSLKYPSTLIAGLWKKKNIFKYTKMQYWTLQEAEDKVQIVVLLYSWKGSYQNFKETVCFHLKVLLCVL